jgi:hypothetical protein
VLDAGWHQYGIESREVLRLKAGVQAGPTFDDEIELVGGAELAARLGLLRFEANELADDTRTVEDADAYRLVPQKPAGRTQVNDFHGYLLCSWYGCAAGERVSYGLDQAATGRGLGNFECVHDGDLVGAAVGDNHHTVHS